MIRREIAAFALGLLLASAALVWFFPAAKAANIPTTANLNVYPPIRVGVGQQVWFTMQLTPTPPPPNLYHGYRISITNPDGIVQTIGPITSDASGATLITYTPTSLGNYTAVFNYPGETFNSTGNTYNQSTSNTVNFTVQEQPVSIVYTTCNVTVSPNLVGVGQMVDIGLSVSPPPPPSVNSFHDLQITIRKPDGSSEVRGPYVSTMSGDLHIQYSVTQNGSYSVYLSYPGEWFGNSVYYFPSGNQTNFTSRATPVKVQLAVTVSGSGTTSPAAGIQLYNPGDSANITAQPNFGWRFDRWLLDGVNVGTWPVYNAVMFSNKSLTAIFVQLPVYSLNIAVNGSGTTNPPAGMNSFPQGTTVNVTAIPTWGWRFDHWMINGTTPNYSQNFSFVLNGNSTLTAVFLQLPVYSLNVTATGSGSTIPAAGISSYPQGTTINASAIPTGGWGFSYWRVNGTNNYNQNFSFAITGNSALTAVFVQLPVYTLNLSINGSGSTNPAAGLISYQQGMLVNVTATPNSGWRFNLWMINGIYTDMNSTYSFTIFNNYSLRAFFTQLTYNLTLSTTGSGTTNPPAGGYSYLSGTTVNVTASPASGWSFSNWLLNGSNVGTNPSYSFSMSGGYTLTAVFAQIPKPPTSYILTIGVTGSGSTNPSAGVQSYLQGTQVNVNAIPSSGWVFSNWALDGSNVNTIPSYSVTMNSAHTLTAVFTKELPPKNEQPVANIVMILSSSSRTQAIQGENVTFRGNGSDTDGFITAYRWTSSIDGLLSNSNEFSTASLSVGTHTIYFEVQDNLGAWSVVTAQTLVVEGANAIPLSIVLTVTAAGFAGSAGVSVFIHFHGKLQSSLKIKNKLQKKLHEESEKQKEEDEKEKREKDQGKPYLKLEADFPFPIMEGMPYEPKLTITNTGKRQAENITVLSDCTPGLLLCTATAEIDVLPAGDNKQLAFPMATSEQIRKGIYSTRFEAECNGVSSTAKTCHVRAVKIGVFSSTTLPESSKRLKDWLKQEPYVFTELENADNLLGWLLNYDLLVLAPDVNLPTKWIRNISSFVRNGQSLCVFDRTITDEQKILANILGYSGIEYELVKCDQGVIKIRNNKDLVLGELSSGDPIRIGRSLGNVCVSAVGTCEVLADFFGSLNENPMKPVVQIPAVTTNIYGKGKVVHFNFHAEESAEQLSKILRQTFNWLLS